MGLRRMHQTRVGKPVNSAVRAAVERTDGRGQRQRVGRGRGRAVNRRVVDVRDDGGRRARDAGRNAKDRDNDQCEGDEERFGLLQGMMSF